MENLVLSMYLDERTANSIQDGCIDNEKFKGNVAPFTYHSEGETKALKKFARAHRANFVKGPPVTLIMISIPAKAAIKHIHDGDLKMMDDRPDRTVGFAKPVNQQNFPTMKVELTTMDVPGLPEELLNSGYELLNS